MIDRQSRANALAFLGVRTADIMALLDYTENHFSPERVVWPLTLPLESEPHTQVWSEYVDAVWRAGSIAPLAHVFPQLRFPIEPGISSTPEYIAATRRGEPGDPAIGLQLGLLRPENVRLVMYDTAAGCIPLVVVQQREDFVSLVRAFTLRNEPGPVPDSQGACMVAGYNNWDRVRRYRAAWEARSPGWPGAWRAEFQRMTARQDLYQDRFIILSQGPYSGVSATEMGMPESQWREISLVIRREHECAHYFTKRVFGSMKNRLHDELMADFAGIAAAQGHYRADWFLRFMGLEHYPMYRTGGRLENYRGDPPLSPGAFTILQRLVVRAARALNRFCTSMGQDLHDPRERAIILIGLASLTLDEVAGDDADACLAHVMAEARQWVRWRAKDGSSSQCGEATACEKRSFFWES